MNLQEVCVKTIKMMHLGKFFNVVKATNFLKLNENADKLTHGFVKEANVVLV